MKLFYLLLVCSCIFVQLLNASCNEYQDSTRAPKHGRPEAPARCTDVGHIYIEDSFPATLEQCEFVCKNSKCCEFFTYNKGRPGRSGTCGIRDYHPSGQIERPNGQVGRKTGVLANCDDYVFVGKTVKIRGGNTG